MTNTWNSAEPCTNDAFRYVHIERPHCPVCGSANLKMKRSILQCDGSRRQSMWCLACPHKFFVILE